MTDPPPIPIDLREVAQVDCSPISSSQRIVSIDALRGIAILGILLMNIQSFAMPVSAYSYPWSWGDMTGANALVFYGCHIVASEKFISIFAMLFGAGLILQQGRNLSPRLHVRRMLVLIGIGLLHAYLFWYGDILFTYGVLGLIVYLFRSFSIRTLFVIAASVFALGLVVNTAIGVISCAASQAAAGSDIASEFNPSPAQQAREIAAYQGKWTAQFRERLPIAVGLETILLFTYSLPFVGSLMLAGMALMKSGFFSLGWKRSDYVRIAILGCVGGWGLSALGLWVDARTGYKPELSVLVWSNINTTAMFPVAIGYASVVMLASQSSLRRWLSPLAAVGRTALSCYLLTTVLCTTIFYGHGLGWFGQVERVGQLGIVIGVWLVLIVFAVIWTRFSRQGPAEWAWRQLTYGSGQSAAKSG